MEFKTEFYGLNKKIKNARRNGFTFNKINISTEKNLFESVKYKCKLLSKT